MAEHARFDRSLLELSAKTEREHAAAFQPLAGRDELWAYYTEHGHTIENVFVATAIAVASDSVIDGEGYVRKFYVDRACAAFAAQLDTVDALIHRGHESIVSALHHDKIVGFHDPALD